MKRKLRKFVVPGIYISLIVASFFSITFINQKLTGEIKHQNYSKGILKDVTQTVLNEYTEKHFIKPFISDKVAEKISFYRNDDEEANQVKSLIYYERTYMPSTGVMYDSDEEFDVIASFDGKVTDIKDDDILGTVVEIAHNENLMTFYYSLKDVKLQKDDEIKQGTIIGKSSVNKINDKNSLFFEVYYNGKLLNPNEFYELNPSELN